MSLKKYAASKPNLAASAIVACCAAVVLAGCASTPQTVSVSAGGSSGTPTPSPSFSASGSPTRPAKPAAEHVPDSPVLTASWQVQPGGTAMRGHSSVITNAKTIAEIASDINALPTLPRFPGIVNCPMQTVGAVLDLGFRNLPDGPVLAEVQLTPKPSGVCGGGVQVTVGGVGEPALDDSGSPDFYARIVQLAGLSTASPSS